MRKCFLILTLFVGDSAGASWGTPFGRMGLALLVGFLLTLFVGFLLTSFVGDSAGASLWVTYRRGILLCSGFESLGNDVVDVRIFFEV